MGLRSESTIKLFSLFIIVLLMAIGSKTVFGQVNLPTISTACESKDGNLTSFNDGFSILKKCNGNSRRIVLVGQKGDQGLPGPTIGKPILDVQSIRGANFATTSATPVPTGNKVTLNCDLTCIFWINYYVDTRNSSSLGAPPNGFSNIYDIYVDGVDQAIFTSASFPVANVAIPLSLNGVTCCYTGSHIVEIYAHTNGGELQSFESGLQVMAIKE